MSAVCTAQHNSWSSHASQISQVVQTKVIHKRRFLQIKLIFIGSVKILFSEIELYSLQLPDDKKIKF